MNRKLYFSAFLRTDGTTSPFRVLITTTGPSSYQSQLQSADSVMSGLKQRWIEVKEFDDLSEALKDARIRCDQMGIDPDSLTKKQI